MNEKYFLYARKSTDVEDKQVLSIEAQIAELRKYARYNGLCIIDTIIEKRTAKIPGRPKFGTMLKRIDAGEASGIVAWRAALAPAVDTRVVFKDSGFADDIAKTNMAAILNQNGITDVRSL